jgi:hypothetical protein
MDLNRDIILTFHGYVLSPFFWMSEFNVTDIYFSWISIPSEFWM